MFANIRCQKYRGGLQRLVTNFKSYKTDDCAQGKTPPPVFKVSIASFVTFLYLLKNQLADENSVKQLSLMIQI